MLTTDYTDFHGGVLNYIALNLHDGMRSKIFGQPHLHAVLLYISFRSVPIRVIRGSLFVSVFKTTITYIDIKSYNVLFVSCAKLVIIPFHLCGLKSVRNHLVRDMGKNIRMGGLGGFGR